MSDEVETAVGIVQAVAECIRELGEVPAGHLYARLSETGMTLNQFEQVVGLLVRVGLVMRPAPNTGGDVLKWVNRGDDS